MKMCLKSSILLLLLPGAVAGAVTVAGDCSLPVIKISKNK